MHTTVDKDRFQSSPMNSSPAISDILQLYHPLAVASMVLWLYCYMPQYHPCTTCRHMTNVVPMLRQPFHIRVPAQDESFAYAHILC